MILFLGHSFVFAQFNAKKASQLNLASFESNSYEFSMLDQVGFLTNIINRKYKLNPTTYDCLLQIMKYNLSYQYVVYCKSGWGQQGYEDIG